MQTGQTASALRALRRKARTHVSCILSWSRQLCKVRFCSSKVCTSLEDSCCIHQHLLCLPVDHCFHRDYNRGVLCPNDCEVTKSSLQVRKVAWINTWRIRLERKVVLLLVHRFISNLAQHFKLESMVKIDDPFKLELISYTAGSHQRSTSRMLL